MRRLKKKREREKRKKVRFNIKVYILKHNIDALETVVGIDVGNAGVLELGRNPVAQLHVGISPAARVGVSGEVQKPRKRK